MTNSTRNTKELIFTGSDYRVIHQVYGQSETILFSGDELTARKLFDSLNARSI